MHPQNTRNRPLLLLNRIEVFTNNINCQVTAGGHRSNVSFFANAVSCFRRNDVEVVCCGINLQKFHVEFWDGETADLHPLLHVVIHAPLHWSPAQFLKVLWQASLANHVLSLINGFYIIGERFPFNTINTIHYYFFTKTKVRLYSFHAIC
jgi:hypothetical protein